MSLCSILTVCCLSRRHNCSLYLCPWALQTAEWIRQWVKYLIELRLHRTISMNQATVNQGFALPVVFQLSIHFDLRVLVCDHLIFHEMISCEHGERSERNNQMRKIYGIQARETGTAQILNCYLQVLMSIKLLHCLMLPPVTLWTACAWDSCWGEWKSVSYRIPQESLPLVPVCEIAIFLMQELIYSFPLKQEKKSWTKAVVSLQNDTK